MASPTPLHAPTGEAAPSRENAEQPTEDACREHTHEHHPHARRHFRLVYEHQKQHARRHHAKPREQSANESARHNSPSHPSASILHANRFPRKACARNSAQSAPNRRISKPNARGTNSSGVWHKKLGRDQPLTAPIITPFTKYFCRKGYTHSTGTVVSTMAAYLMDSANSFT